MSYAPKDQDNDQDRHSSSRGNSFSHPEAKNDIWANYKAYLSRTSILIPVPPALYKPLPGWLKKTLLFDLPMFNFDEKKDGDEALEEERKKRADA
jgi:hypothetical protein